MSTIPVPNPERIRKIIALEGEAPSAINIPSGCRFHPRCPYKNDECKLKEPPLVEIEKEQLVACDRAHT